MGDKFRPSLDYRAPTWYQAGGWQELVLVGGAYRLGVFKILAAGARTASSLAAAINGDERATTVLLEALATAGYLTNQENKYHLPDGVADMLVNEDHPNFIGYSISHSLRLAERWLTLPKVIKDGRPVPGDRFTETAEGFIKAMDVYAKRTADQVVKHCLAKRAQARAALDIGGATGTVSRLLAKAGLKVTLFDTPEVISLNQAALGDNPNITLVGGDFNEKLPSGPFDLAYLGNITHIYGAAKNTSLFKRVYESLAPGGLIAVLDFVRGFSASAPLFAVNMLVNTSEGGTWTLDEFSEWLSGAGFKDIEYINVSGRDQQLITALKR